MPGPDGFNHPIEDVMRSLSPDQREHARVPYDEHNPRAEIIPPTRPEPVAGMRLFSVVVISTVGGAVHADTTLELAETPDIAKNLAISHMPKGRLLQKIDAFHVSKERLEQALRVVVA